MSTNELVTVTTVVRVAPATAFDRFTGEIGQWWKPKVAPLFGRQAGAMKFERRRLLALSPDPEVEPFEVGRVLEWTPGERLVFEWRQAGFARAKPRRLRCALKPWATELASR